MVSIRDYFQKKKISKTFSNPKRLNSTVLFNDYKSTYRLIVMEDYPETVIQSINMITK